MSFPVIHTIDLQFQGVPNAISSYLVEGGNGLVLIETGPGSTLATLREGIAALGFSESDIRDVLVTHIHLDHSGAAGWWAQQGAKIYVHPRGARHLIDPSRLIESATMIYGDQMDTLWGEILPAPEERVISVEDGDKVFAGGLEFVAWDTPGHARHHHAFVLEEAGMVFSGDVAGVRLPNSNYIQPATAPPQFDPVAYVESIQRLEDAGFEKLALTHFGIIEGKENVAEHFSDYRNDVELAAEFVRLRMGEGMDAESLQIAYQAFQMEMAFRAETPGELWASYETANPCGMCADGIRIYWEKAAQD